MGSDPDTAQGVRRIELEALIAHVTELDGLLRQLAGKWRAQADHPQRRFRPEEAILLRRHAGELEELLNGSDTK
jgi:hypothetical protein